MSTKHAKLTRKSLEKIASVNLTIEPEIGRPGEHFDPGESLDWVNAELANGNPWAWCIVTVYADHDGCRGIASLGACSYENRKAFDDAGETAQLTSEALDDLWRLLEARTPAGRAKALALSSRQAIVTTFRGPTGGSRCAGARIIAKCEAKRISVPWDDELDTGANYAAAALQLMDQLGWSEKNDLVMGGTREGYVFVQVPKRV